MRYTPAPEVEGNNFDAGFKECEAAHLDPLLESIHEAIDLMKKGYQETAHLLIEEAFRKADFRHGYKHD